MITPTDLILLAGVIAGMKPFDDGRPILSIFEALTGTICLIALAMRAYRVGLP